MFREMRRKKQLLPDDEAIAVLERGTSGVLALSGDDGYPYAVPLSYAYKDGKLFFHCAPTGHKLDAIARNEKASFCVIDLDHLVPEELTTYFRSTIAFGRLRLLESPEEKKSALILLDEKYAPGYDHSRVGKKDAQFRQVAILELTVEHLTGKEAIELVREKGRT